MVTLAVRGAGINQTGMSGDFGCMLAVEWWSGREDRKPNNAATM